MKPLDLGRRSIRRRLLTWMVGLTVVLVALMTGVQLGVQKRLLERELDNRITLIKRNMQERGATLAEYLARQVENDVAKFDYAYIHETLQRAVAGDPELDFAILMDGNNVAHVHTRPYLVREKLEGPEDLFAAQQRAMATNQYQGEDQTYIELIAPIYTGRRHWGVLRLGFSLEAVNEEIVSSRAEIAKQSERRLYDSILTALLFGLVAAAIVIFVSTSISRPIVALTEVAHRLARGDFSAAERIVVASGDEIGILGRSFLTMSQNLEESHGKLEEYNRTLEQRVIARTVELSDKNEELNARCKELETLENFVVIINREFKFDNVLNTLLRQGLQLFPHAERGAFLIQRAEGSFRFAATVGYDIEELSGLDLSLEEATRHHIAKTREVDEDVFLVLLNRDETIERLVSFRRTRELLVMPLRLHGDLEGFLILDNLGYAEGYDLSDLHKLVRFREHAVSAVAKARTMRELQEKNREIIRTQNQLVIQEKMASLGTLTAGIAHEIKNPLNFINNFGEVIVDLARELAQELAGVRSLLGEEAYETFEEIAGDMAQSADKIVKHGRRADHIIHGMLMLSRGASGQLEIVDVNALIEEYVNLAYHGLRAQDKSMSLNFKMDLDPKAGHIEVVPENISRVFLNVVNNACYAAKQKQKEGEDFVPTVSVTTRDMGDRVEIRVRDNGTGIPDEIKQRVFTPFFTTKPAGKGTGLGLSISYDIVVTEHGGAFRIDSEQGAFTEVSMVLYRRFPVKPKQVDLRTAG
ncbi:Histidine kinase [Sulfidibacter corallicola]|uniref:histidine kinase n=1 Tax=Sulfidibacter corallicola TaxID=2818388 RepID=A0A8A4TWI2_SULCO|nr:ATP-binding protein [Sulfidibacter corallicola]QTD50875.1 HAMP domain-containing protein [Sulfidibacter corallicola]